MCAERTTAVVVPRY